MTVGRKCNADFASQLCLSAASFGRLLHACCQISDFTVLEGGSRKIPTRFYFPEFEHCVSDILLLALLFSSQVFPVKARVQRRRRRMNGSVVSRRQEGVVINRKSTAADHESASGIVTEEFRFTQGKAKKSLSVSGLILLTIEVAITIVQTKVLPMANLVTSMMPVKAIRGLFLDGLFSMMFFLPLAIVKTILVQLGLDKTIANWLEIESNVVIVAGDQEVQKEMERMRNYIRDVNDVNTRLSNQKDFLNAELNMKTLQLEKENKQMKDHLQELDQTCRSIHSQLSTSKNDGAVLRTRLNETESTLKKTEANLFAAQEENRVNQRVMKEKEQLQKKLQDTTDEWNRASSEIKMLRKESDRREEVIKATADELVVVRRDLENIQVNSQREAMKTQDIMERRNALEQTVQEKEQMIQEMRNTVEQMQQQKAQWESDMQQMKERTGHSENEVRRVVEDMRVAQSQREEAQQNVQAIYQERDHLRHELEDTRMQLNRTRQELELMRGNMEHEMGELRRQLEQNSKKQVVIHEKEVIVNGGSESPSSDQQLDSQQANPSKKKKQNTLKQ